MYITFVVKEVTYNRHDTDTHLLLLFMTSA